jgi:hypothetical protein
VDYAAQTVRDHAALAEAVRSPDHRADRDLSRKTPAAPALR